ncbi:EpsI_fam, EpsI family protein [Comamonadaceae bacterium]
MVVAAACAYAMTPRIYLADQRPKVELAQLIPTSFGDWREVTQSSGQIINPQQTALLEKLYSQTLSRSYVNSEGVVIMLSIAYGASQSDGVALHYPEVCYPAQGFQLQSNVPVVLDTKFGAIEGRQLMTRLGQRNEPVTYWSTMGDKVVRGGMKTKLAQLDYGFNGLIPDGLIFRVSSITRDAPKGYSDQSNFINDLILALPSASRLRLAGLGA